ncbi:MAG: hypothetical protein VB108_05695 [Anaerolineaceae bacterium]|nr:hypothetical protein [Anaerolineaceae bacterium]
MDKQTEAVITQVEKLLETNTLGAQEAETLKYFLKIGKKGVLDTVPEGEGVSIVAIHESSCPVTQEEPWLCTCQPEIAHMIEPPAKALYALKKCRMRHKSKVPNNVDRAGGSYRRE